MATAPSSRRVQDPNPSQPNTAPSQPRAENRNLISAAPDPYKSPRSVDAARPTARMSSAIQGLPMDFSDSGIHATPIAARIGSLANPFGRPASSGANHSCQSSGPYWFIRNCPDQLFLQIEATPISADQIVAPNLLQDWAKLKRSLKFSAQTERIKQQSFQLLIGSCFRRLSQRTIGSVNQNIYNTTNDPYSCLCTVELAAQSLQYPFERIYSYGVVAGRS